MKRVFGLLTTLLLFFACTKQANERTGQGVWVRIENNSGEQFDNAAIGSVEYNVITDGETSAYKLMNEPIYAVACLVTINKQTIFAGVGVCGTPPPPPISAGYYTLKIGSKTPEGSYITSVSNQ